MLRGNNPAQTSLQLTKLGHDAYKANEFVKAKDYYTQALEIDPNNIEARINLAQIMFVNFKDYESALAHYKLFHQQNKDSELSKEYPNKLKEYAFILMMDFNDFEKAIQQIELAIKSHTSQVYLTALIECLNIYADGVIAYLISSVKNKDDIAKTITSDLFYKGVSKYLMPHILRRGLAKGNPLGDIMWEKRGTSEPSIESGNLKKLNKKLNTVVNYVADENTSVEELNKLIKLDPTNPELYKHLGNNYFYNETLKKGYEELRETSIKYALSYYSQFIMLSPNDSFGFLQISRCLYALGNFQKSLEYIDEAIAKDPLNKSHYLLKIQILDSLNRSNEAGIIKKVLEIGFADELDKQKNKKKFLFEQVCSLPPSQRLPLLKMITDKETILGIYMWMKEGIFDKPSLQSGILKEVQDEIDRLEPPKKDKVQAIDQPAIPVTSPAKINRFSIFDTDFSLHEDNENNNKLSTKEVKTSVSGNHNGIFAKIKIFLESKPKNITSNFTEEPSKRLSKSSL